MSTQLHQFITNVLAMPHYSNDNAGSGDKFNSHEDALKHELEKVGYSQIEQHGKRINRNGKTVKKLTFPKLTLKALKAAMDSSDRQNEIAKLVNGLLPGEYIHQPLGSQHFPDFLIKDFSGSLVVVEAKSNNTNAHPTWNDSLPKSDSIYIFSSGKYNQSTVFLGQDVLDASQEAIMTKYRNMCQHLITECRSELDAIPDSVGRGFTLQFRQKFDQQGGASKTNYFTHHARQTCEQNVLTFALNQ